MDWLIVFHFIEKPCEIPSKKAYWRLFCTPNAKHTLMLAVANNAIHKISNKMNSTQTLFSIEWIKHICVPSWKWSSTELVAMHSRIGFHMQNLIQQGNIEGILLLPTFCNRLYFQMRLCLFKYCLCRYHTVLEQSHCVISETIVERFEAYYIVSCC